MDSLTKRAARAFLIKQGLESVLLSEGFSRTSGRPIWIRHADGLDHAVALGWRWSYGVEFGLLCSDAVWILYGAEPDVDDINQAIALGRASTISHPAATSGFRLEDVNPLDEVERVAAALRADAQAIATFTERFVRRADLIAHLLREGDGGSDAKGFLFPTSLGLCQLTAAALMVAEEDDVPQDLIASIESGFGNADERVIRLREALATPRA